MKDNGWAARIRATLADGPKTSREIAPKLGLSSAELASLMVKMRRYGYVTRVLGKRNKATYTWVGPAP